jgi:hypothetical protein
MPDQSFMDTHLMKCAILYALFPLFHEWTGSRVLFWSHPFVVSNLLHFYSCLPTQLLGRELCRVIMGDHHPFKLGWECWLFIEGLSAASMDAQGFFMKYLFPTWPFRAPSIILGHLRAVSSYQYFSSANERRY